MTSAWLGLFQLICLFVFVVVVYWCNLHRPAGTVYRPFRIKWWASAMGGAMVVIYLLILIRAPGFLQNTLPAVKEHHAAGRAACHLLTKPEDLNAKSILFESEYIHDKQRAVVRTPLRATVVSILLPFINTLLFNTGVTIAMVPILIQLLAMRFKLVDLLGSASSGSSNSNGSLQNTPAQREIERREWGVLLPVLNLITIVSAFTAPTFYLFVQPSRVDRCIYTSGHWFTFTVTVLTFVIIVAHLASYQQYCRSSGKLLTLYIAWFAVYIMTALSTLKKTQELYHDDVEAADGMRQALPVFVVYFLIFLAVQYATHASTAGQLQKEYEEETVTEEQNIKSTKEIANITPSSKKSVSPISSIPSAPDISPPSDDAIPEAPPAPPGPPAQFATSVPSAPLITKAALSKPLKKGNTTAAAPLPIPDDPHAALLNQITNHRPLRKTKVNPNRPSPNDTGLALLMKGIRAAVQPDAEEEERRDTDKWE